MDLDDETGRRNLLNLADSFHALSSVGHFPLGRSSSLTPARSANQFGSSSPPAFVIACPLKFSHAPPNNRLDFTNTTIIAKTRIHLFPTAFAAVFFRLSMLSRRRHLIARRDVPSLAHSARTYRA